MPSSCYFVQNLELTPFPELKRRPSSKRTSQSVKEKHQKPLHVNEPEVGNYEYGDDYENEEGKTSLQS